MTRGGRDGDRWGRPISGAGAEQAPIGREAVKNTEMIAEKV